MKLASIAAIQAAVNLITESLPELRERCADTTHAKFLAVRADLETALREDPEGSPAEPSHIVMSAEDAAAVGERLQELLAPLAALTPDAIADAIAVKLAPDLAAAVIAAGNPGA